MSFSFQSLADEKKPSQHWISGHNNTDKDDNPAGGYAIDYSDSEKGYERFRINWQDGPLNRDAGETANGAFVEDVLEVCRIRLEFYEESRFACPENAEAIMCIKTAVMALMDRRRKREEQNVLGKNEPHSSATLRRRNRNPAKYDCSFHADDKEKALLVLDYLERAEGFSENCYLVLYEIDGQRRSICFHTPEMTERRQLEDWLRETFPGLCSGGGTSLVGDEPTDHNFEADIREVREVLSKNEP